MNTEEKKYAEEIATEWNSGNREGAKKLFMKYQLVIGEKLKNFFKKKMTLYFNQKGHYIYKEPEKNE